MNTKIPRLFRNFYQYNGEVMPSSLITPAMQVDAMPSELNESKSGKKVYIESYGCQMNFSDSEIVVSILKKEGYEVVPSYQEADLVLLNTCSIRAKAEQKVRSRISQFQEAKRVRPYMLLGVLGCMAERLKSKLLDEEKIVDLVVGPDAYRSLPILVKQAEEGHRALNVLLSREETYADISPVRLDSNGVSAFVSIMRGCDNMCSFCVVPFTRGRERSRSPQTIEEECRQLVEQGYREVTLLGQNVDSFFYTNPLTGETTNFAQLLGVVARVNPLLRVRFSTSHPKDITEDVLWTMKQYCNICKYIHLPVQSGSSRILGLMNRTYTREWYLDKVRLIRSIIPNCAISTDIIAGFCTETEDDHAFTLSLIEKCQFDYAYMFMYSERSGTLAARQMTDDVPHETKQRRLSEIIELQRSYSLASMQRGVGKMFNVLIEGDSKRSTGRWRARNDQNQVIVFDKGNPKLKKGVYVEVCVTSSSAATHHAVVV